MKWKEITIACLVQTIVMVVCVKYVTAAVAATMGVFAHLAARFIVSRIDQS